GRSHHGLRPFFVPSKQCRPYFFTSTTGVCSASRIFSKKSLTVAYLSTGTNVCRVDSDLLKISLSPLTSYCVEYLPNGVSRFTASGVSSTVKPDGRLNVAVSFIAIESSAIGCVRFGCVR